MNVKLVIQYDGTRYDGWQRQGNTANTIQGKLEAVLSKMDGADCEVQGSGRTDAGVHAYGQVVSVHLKNRREPEEIRTYMNHYLPDDIEIITAKEAPERFHARLNATRKTYLYQIGIGDGKHVFDRKYCYQIHESLDMEKMRQAAQALCGTHDFQSFCATKRSKKSTVRTLEKITIDIDEHAHMMRLRFTGNGFLYNMVRILTGTLIEVGEGTMNVSDIPGIFEAKDRTKAGMTAPAQGLFLEKVFYGAIK